MVSLMPSEPISCGHVGFEKGANGPRMVVSGDSLQITELPVTALRRLQRELAYLIGQYDKNGQ